MMESSTQATLLEYFKRIVSLFLHVKCICTVSKKDSAIHPRFVVLIVLNKTIAIFQHHKRHGNNWSFLLLLQYWRGIITPVVQRLNPCFMVQPLAQPTYRPHPPDGAEARIWDMPPMLPPVRRAVGREPLPPPPPPPPPPPLPLEPPPERRITPPLACGFPLLPHSDEKLVQGRKKGWLEVLGVTH